jgi:hypothetical protein
VLEVGVDGGAGAWGGGGGDGSVAAGLYGPNPGPVEPVWT